MKSEISKAGFLIAASLLALLPVTSANAGTTGRFHIPFPFVAGNKALPAGDYVVRVNAASRSIELNSPDGGARLFLTGNSPYRSAEAADNGSLIFKKYGKTYFLNQTWKTGSQWGYELPASKAEREMAKADASDSAVTVSLAGGSN